MNHEAPYYSVSSAPLLPRPSCAQVSPPVSCSQILSAYIRFSKWEIKILIRITQQAILYFRIFQFLHFLGSEL